MLECSNCGAVGDSFFSANYFGEMVCELCGTQSFQQARNETQDAEDMVVDVLRVSATLKRQRKRKIRQPKAKKHKREYQKPGDVQLSDCLVASQMILDFQAKALMEKVGEETFPPEYARVVKQLWFKLLEAWGTKGEIPMLRCFTEWAMRSSVEEKLEPAMTTDLLEQWDAEREKEREEQERQERHERQREQTRRRREEREEKKKEESDSDESEKRQESDDSDSDEAESVKTESVVAESVKSESTKTESVTGEKMKRVPGRQRGLKHNEGWYKIYNHCGKLDRFSILDLVGLLVLASRVLNLGLMPSNFANWIASGVLPFHNLLATCCADAPDVRESVAGVAYFFNSVFKRYNVSSARIAFHAHFLQHHLGLRLPPLNVPLAAHRLCRQLGLPGEVFRNFQWITGFFNVDGDQPELPLLLVKDALYRSTRNTVRSRAFVEELLTSETGIIAHLAVAIRMCAGWEEWVFERSRRSEDGPEAVPFATALEPSRLLRRDLGGFVDFCEQAFTQPERYGIPPTFQEHVDDLKKLHSAREMQDLDNEEVGSFKQHDVYAYPAVHVNGVLAESDRDIEQRVDSLRSQDTDDAAEEKDPTFFYPVYSFHNRRRGALHAPFENLLELLCQQVGTPISSVFISVRDLDRRIDQLGKTLLFGRTRKRVTFKAKPEQAESPGDAEEKDEEESEED